MLEPVPEAGDDLERCALPLVNTGDTMRIAGKIMLLSAIALACTAFTAGGASASEGVEFENIDGGDCNCLFHLDGESHLTRIDTGARISSCADEYDVGLNHSGDVTVTWAGFIHSAPGCNTINCLIMSRIWRNGSATEEIAPGVVEFQVQACFKSSVTGIESECTVDVIATALGGGAYHFGTATICLAGFRVEFEATTETGEGFVAHHS